MIVSRHRAEAIRALPVRDQRVTQIARLSPRDRTAANRAAQAVAVPTSRVVKVRSRSALPLFASAAALAVVLVSVTSPMSQNSAAAAEITAELQALPTQHLTVSGTYVSTIVRDTYSLTEKVVPATPPAAAVAPRAAPAAGVPNPGSAQDIAHQMVADRGWGDEQFNCLVALWNRESGWNAFAHNGGSGAYGIPQALPGTKWPLQGPTGRQTRPRRSSGASATFRAGTARRVARGRQVRPRAGTDPFRVH